MEVPDGEDHQLDVVDPVLRAHISSLCSALGGSHTSETGEYVLGDEALGCLKDLKRWLKGYDEKLNRFDVARVMAECHLVTGDLLEILAAWPQDQTEDKVKSKIALACVELLVPLTWPLNKDPAKMTVNHHKHMGVLEYAQVAYKKGLLHHKSHKVLRNCIRTCLSSMNLTPAQRTERDEGIIKLVLYLIRNIAIIQHPNPTETDTGEEVSRAATIEAFAEHNILDLLVMVASQMGEEFNTQDTIVLEILYHLLKGVDIEKLFMTDKEQSKKGISQLESLLNLEKSIKAKNAKVQSTRHSRFGTMLWVQKQDGRRVAVSGQDVLIDKSKGLAKMDQTKKWKKPKNRRQKNTSANDFDLTVTLKGPSKKLLREFVEQFLDAGFNPLYSHLRRAIEREAERILQDSHPRQYLYLISWFLAGERERRKNQPPEEVEGVNLSFSLIAAVLNQETMILLKKYMMEWFDTKQWTDLEAGMRCMIQLLLTVQDMALSPLEDDQDIAENMQNRLFYEESTLELILSILRSYKAQPFGYLDACTDLAHVHLRMLERYSKQNIHIFIKSKRQKASRRKTASSSTGIDDQSAGDIAESDEELEAENTRLTRERAFDFIKYESRFLTQPSVDAYLRLLQYYKELNYVQIKRALSFLHRVFVKREMETVLFRIDVLELLNRIVQGEDALPSSHQAYKEVHQFAKHYIKQLVRKLQKTPALYIELLFTKTNRSNHFIQYGHEPELKIKKPRQPAELEVSPKLSYPEQVGVAVSVLLNENKDDIVDWLKKVLGKAVDEKLAWESETTARRMEEVTLREQGDSGAGEGAKEVKLDGANSTADGPIIPLMLDSDERKKVVSKDPKVMMLLRLLGLRGFNLDDNDIVKWEFPPSVTSADLKERLALLKEYTDEPPVYEDGQTAEDFIRRKAKPRADRLESSDGSSDGDDEDDEDDDTDMDLPFDENGNPFQPNLLKTKSKKDKKDKKEKRRRRRKDEEAGDDVDASAAEARREAKRLRDEEKQKQIKSKLYIDDEDDMSDEERDKAFFEKERALRELMERTGGMGFPPPNADVVRKGKRKKGKDGKGSSGDGAKRRRGEKVIVEEGESGSEDKEVDDEDRIPAKEEQSLFFSDDEDEEMVDAESDAEESASSPAARPPSPPAPVKQQRLKSLSIESDQATERDASEPLPTDDDDETPVAALKSQARQRLVVDSDEE